MNQRSLLLALLATLVVSSVGAQKFKALVATITQPGNISSPFTITLNGNEKLIIDIESPFSWHRCPREFPRISCHDVVCSMAHSNQSPFCHLNIPRSPLRPPCTCFTLPSNPFSKTCASSQLTYTNVSIDSTDGHNPLAQINYNKIFMSCAPKSLLLSLPNGASGIASLSKGSLSLVSQFSKSKTVKKIGLCLGDQGVAFFGEGPYYLLPPPGREATRFLTYTPLLNNPKDTLGYYIGMKGISINSQGVNFTKSPLSFDALGNGGFKLSTVTRYTTLRRHIYRALLSQFAMSTNKIPRAPRVEPFDYCLNTTNLGSTRTGLPVPQIDLELNNGVNWTIFGANSMVHVSNDVACLAFVDGGHKANHAMVIGTYQMEHTFLLFDLVKSKLGFSSSLLFFRTSCNSFNFTTSSH